MPTDANFVISDKAKEITKRLRNVYSNDRLIEMVVERNIPSYIKIAEKKVKVWYHGQEFSCARCFQSVRHCPGGAVAKACQTKNPNLKVEFNDYWEVVKNKLPFRDPIREGEDFETETVKIYSFPKEATRDDIYEWVRQQGVTIVPEKIIPTSKTSTSWFLVHLGKDNVEFTVKQLNKKLYGKGKEQRYIQCVPTSITTPEKKKHGLRETKDASFEKQSRLLQNTISHLVKI